MLSARSGTEGHYRNTKPGMCRVQSLFDSLGDEVKGKALGLGGDGRYFNKEAVQTILKLAAGAGVKKVCSSACLHVAAPYHPQLSCKTPMCKVHWQEMP